MSEDSLGDRMKGYEAVNRFHLPGKLPLIIRLDGKAFHTYTRGLQRPYSDKLMGAMNQVAAFLCKEVQNTVLAYTQSDEISLVLRDYDDIKTTAWFDGNLQKIVSVAAGLASAKLTELSPTVFGQVKLATFDARAFILPPHEVVNYLIWRQQDWNRNSLAMLAQSMYSHKELQGKGRAEQHELCFQKGVNWADLHSHIKDGRMLTREGTTEPVSYQRGLNVETTLVTRWKWQVRDTTPIFNESKDYIENLLTSA